MEGHQQDNRYGPPHFSDQENRVSIWLGIVPLDEIPEDYFQENYQDEDKPFTHFSADFGFGFYDHDFVEMMTGGENVADSVPKPVRFLLDVTSYNDSFLQRALLAANECGITESELAFLMYDFEYDPKVTGITQSKWLRFIGCFDYDKDAE